MHDNGGRRDDHLVPFAGTIDWDAAMMATQKIGYDGALMLEVGDTGDPVDVLRRSVKARERLEKTVRHVLEAGPESSSVSPPQNVACPGVRGNGMTSRMFAMPVA